MSQARRRRDVFFHQMTARIELGVPLFWSSYFENVVSRLDLPLNLIRIAPMGNWLKKIRRSLVTVVLPADNVGAPLTRYGTVHFFRKAEASAFIHNDPASQELQKSMDMLIHDHAAMDKSLENTEFELETLVRASAEIAKAQQTAATQQQLAALQLTALAEQYGRWTLLNYRSTGLTGPGQSSPRSTRHAPVCQVSSGLTWRGYRESPGVWTKRQPDPNLRFWRKRRVGSTTHPGV